ncbi:hypothetical protein D9757_014919 [Collybiopsis confluens]|uniref:Uncharacterized protein n=1 Tax=Collybiopsis confluens TaxID=2823264 RepID=A0A8H5CJG9_9AGAR|nr:hypothetical protein D9757_014919 [Collybiopsis confluens]
MVRPFNVATLAADCGSSSLLGASSVMYQVGVFKQGSDKLAAMSPEADVEIKRKSVFNHKCHHRAPGDSEPCDRTRDRSRGLPPGDLKNSLEKRRFISLVQHSLSLSLSRTIWAHSKHGAAFPSGCQVKEQKKGPGRRRRARVAVEKSKVDRKGKEQAVDAEISGSLSSSESGLFSSDQVKRLNTLLKGLPLLPLQNSRPLLAARTRWSSKELRGSCASPGSFSDRTV